MFSVKKRADFMKKEVNELRCLEQKLSRQNELMAAPLAALGGAPPPRAMCEAAAAAIVAAATGTTSTSLVSENNGNGIGMVNNLNDVGAIRGSQSQVRLRFHIHHRTSTVYTVRTMCTARTHCT